MSKRKTIAELEAAAKAADKRARELRAKARELSRAEIAKENAELVKAVRAWNDSREHPAEIGDLIAWYKRHTKTADADDEISAPYWQ